MQNNIIFQAKKAALELDEYIDSDCFHKLFRTAWLSKESKYWDQSDLDGFHITVNAAYKFLVGIEFLRKHCEFHNPEIMDISDYTYYEDFLCNNIPDQDFLKLLSDLYDKVQPQKLSWDLWTLFVACFDSDKFLMSKGDYANTGFYIKLISNFVTQWSILVPDKNSGHICMDVLEFDKARFN